MDRLYSLLYKNNFLPLLCVLCVYARVHRFIQKGHWEHVDTQELILVYLLLFHGTNIAGPLNIY